MANHMFTKEGIISFYKGIDSSIFRQITYSSGRLGLYKTLYDRRLKEKGEVSFAYKVVYSLCGGFVGACIGNPADLTMVRRQTDLALPPELRRNYGNVFQSLVRVAKEEGFLALWRGTPFTILRVCALTCGQVTTFDEIKERTRKWRDKPDDIYNRFAAAGVSGFVSSATALPFDNIKVKFQKMIMNPDGTWPYKSFVDCVSKTMRREGLAGFWSGFPAFYMLVGPHTLIMLLVQDYLHIAYSNYRNKQY
jgi:solute carrier family 25 oxoglutarate transporter 11